MSDVNGLATPSLSDTSRSSTPATPDRSANRLSINVKVPGWSLTRDQKSANEASSSGEGGLPRIKKYLDEPFDADAGKRIHEDELSPTSLPIHPKSELAYGVKEKAERKDRDYLENRPFSSGSDYRSTSLIRSPSTKSAASINSNKDPTETK